MSPKLFSWEPSRSFSLARLGGRPRSNIGVSAIIPLSMTCRCPRSLSSADPGRVRWGDLQVGGRSQTLIIKMEERANDIFFLLNASTVNISEHLQKYIRRRRRKGGVRQTIFPFLICLRDCSLLKRYILNLSNITLLICCSEYLQDCLLFHISICE